MIPIYVPTPIENLETSNLCGWKKNRIVVSNNADPRTMDFDFESTIYRNWPSYRGKRRRRHAQGIIQFNNHSIFDRHKQTILGVPKFLFHYKDVTVYWELYLQTKKLREALNVLADEDFFAAAELIVQPIDPKVMVQRPRMSRSWIEGELSRHLPAVGLRQLRELVTLLTLTVPVPDRQALNVAA